MEEPKTKKDIQKLNGRVAALNRFSSKFAKRSLPFFNALKGKGTIEWGPEQSKAFAELKEYIEKMAILSPPSLGATSLIRGRFKSRGQRRSGARGGGGKRKALVSRLFRLRSLVRLQIAIFQAGENYLCDCHGHAKAQALFRGTQGHRAHGSTLK
jgi:hypothetical protein